MRPTLGMVSGLLVGSGLTILFDPVSGRGRRAQARARLGHLSRVAAHGVGVGARDLSHRARGVLAEARSSVFAARDLTDDVIEDRIRSKLGRFVSHPHSIEVFSDDGHVTLHGVILRAEVESFLAAVSKVRGVRAIRDELRAHENAEGVSGLQGGRSRPGVRVDLFQSRWAPGTRLLIGLAGIGLGSLSWTRRGALAFLPGAVGSLVLISALANLTPARLRSAGPLRRARQEVSQASWLNESAARESETAAS